MSSYTSNEEIFKFKQYPSWVMGHSIFKKIAGVRKIFPTIGLENYEHSIIIDNTANVIKHAETVIDFIRSEFDFAYSNINALGKNEKPESAIFFQALKQIGDAIADKKSSIIFDDKGVANLVLPKNIVINDNVLFKAGARLFKIYNQAQTDLLELKISIASLAASYQFKNFSSVNIPAKATIIKFTSDGGEGIWDIATMSMRGISSCQSWDQGAGNSAKIIGSMIDPFTGIIYMQSSEPTTSQFGSKMIRRCIVRYVHNAKNEPYLLLEKMYPAGDADTQKTFTKILKEKSGLEVIYSMDVGGKVGSSTLLSTSYVPLSSEIETLESSYRPYCDSGLSYKKDPNCKFLQIDVEKLKKEFKEKIPNIFKKAFNSSGFNRINLEKYGNDAFEVFDEYRRRQTKEDSPVPCETLGNKFIDYIIDNKLSENPIAYLISHNEKCSEFFQNEMKIKNQDLARFIPSTISSYLIKNKL